MTVKNDSVNHLSVVLLTGAAAGCLRMRDLHGRSLHGEVKENSNQECELIKRSFMNLRRLSSEIWVQYGKKLWKLDIMLSGPYCMIK
ncbi:hypothetical protein AVR63_04020 [Bacillus velezensis]|nr:hypothetical protein AVR63_04020 [Bacillus velezensis]